MVERGSVMGSSQDGVRAEALGAAATPQAEGVSLEEALRADSVSKFIAVAKDWIPVERQKGDIRVTPRGLFVHKDSLDILIDCYQKWFQGVAPHAAERQPSRILKRMFGTSTPQLLYLVEQKRALVGHLIAAPVANPQALGLPVYLGSLEDGTQQIHPRDPLLQCMPQLTVKHAPEGVIFCIQLSAPLRGFSTLQFSTELVRSFARLATHSRVLKEKLPEESPPLRDALRLMLELLGEAKVAHPEQRLLLPFSMQPATPSQSRGSTARGSPQSNPAQARPHAPPATSSSETLFVQHLYWSVKANGVIERVYEREGQNLSFFIRQELAGISRESRFARIRDFEIARHRSDAVGRFRFYGRDYPLHQHALLQFVKGVLRTAPEPEAPLKVLGVDGAARPSAPPKQDWTRFSLLECLDLMSVLLLKAEQVDFVRVQRFLPPERRGRYLYRMHERWVFVLDIKNNVVDCIDKLSAGGAGQPHGGRETPRQGTAGRSDAARRGSRRGRSRGSATPGPGGGKN